MSTRRIVETKGPVTADPKNRGSGKGGLGHYEASVMIEALKALLEIIGKQNELRDIESDMTADNIAAEGMIGRASASAAKSSLNKEADLIGMQAYEAFAGAGTTALSEGAAGGMQVRASKQLGPINERLGDAQSSQDLLLNSKGAGGNPQFRVGGDPIVTDGQTAGGYSADLISTGASEVAHGATNTQLADMGIESKSINDPRSPKEIVAEEMSAKDRTEGLKTAERKVQSISNEYNTKQSVSTNRQQMVRSLGNFANQSSSGILKKYFEEGIKRAQASYEAVKTVLSTAGSQVQAGEQALRGDYQKKAQDASDTISILREIARTNEYRA